MSTGTEAHTFEFSTNWSETRRRLCKRCSLDYDAGEHIEVKVLKPFTNYVCPVGAGQLGHSGVYSGAQNSPELRSPQDKFCICGAEFIEEDTETWRLSFEIPALHTGERTPVERVGTRTSTHNQKAGLEELVRAGEHVRKIRLTRLVERS